MAIDSRNKRASCISIARPNLGRAWTNPAAGELATAAGRQHAAYSYEGILASGTVAATQQYTTRIMLMGVGS